MELYYTGAITNSISICISTLTDEQLYDCGAYEKFGGIGYFLYERHILDGEEEIEILARLSSDEAAETLARLLKLEDPRFSPAFPRRADRRQSR